MGFHTAGMSQAITYLSSLSLICAFALLALRTLHLCIKVYAAQSIFLGLAALFLGIELERRHFLGIVLIVIFIKGFLIPWFLSRVMDKVKIKRETSPFVSYPLSLFIGVGLSLLSYGIFQKFTNLDPFAMGGFSLAVTLMLIGLWLMVSRSKAMIQVIGLLVVENGLFVAALSTTFGMPMIIELGIAFDLFVAVIVMGLLIFRIQNTFSSIHMEHLTQLKG